MTEHFIPTNKGVAMQMYLGIQTFKHRTVEAYLAQYNWDRNEDLRDKGLWCMLFYFDKDGKRMRETMILSDEMVHKKGEVDFLLNKRIKQLTK